MMTTKCAKLIAIATFVGKSRPSALATELSERSCRIERLSGDKHSMISK
jgi:hypothetical protein